MRRFSFDGISRFPVTTYRLGFSKTFRLSAATRLLTYLDRLGVTTLYASPLFSARSGSSHGYDLTDPTRLNPEIGNMAEMERLARGLSSREMGLLLDIVPNHMAAHYENPWWRDLLENGESSPFSMFFDVDWSPPQRALDHRISIPVLGDSYRKVLENQELELVFEKKSFAIRYWETLFPVDPATLSPIFQDLRERIPPEAQEDRHTLEELIKRTRNLPERRTDPLARRLRARHRRHTQLTLHRLSRDSPAFSQALLQLLEEYRGIRGIPSSFDRLDSLLSTQVYWLSHWKTVTRTLNYRRFFDVADLVGVRMEDDRVFEAFHRLVHLGIRQGWIDGVRVDHVDGLRDPADYLHRLSRVFHDERPDRPVLIWVEKILGRAETLPDWPVMGTTGYEFASRITDLFTDPEGFRSLCRWYEEDLAPGESFPETAYLQKKFVAEILMGGELRRLTLLLEWIAMEERDVRETGFRELQTGLVEVTACMDVYRTYINGESVPEDSSHRLRQALDEARRRHPNRRQGLFRFFERVLTLDFPPGADTRKKERWTDFVLKWQQFSGAVMAKGVEDTTFYLYGPLLSANEVGGDPGKSPASPLEFHTFNRQRLERYPLSLSTTSTHDMKRSGDLRIRIAAIASHAEAWIAGVEKWRRWNRPLRKNPRGGQEIPHPSLEHFIYQTLAGAWPLSKPEQVGFGERLETYFVKALRESKRLTNWISPDTAYEGHVCRFVREILKPERKSPFLSDFLAFQKKIAREGASLSLSQLVLKATAPGVFDLYGGDELWEFSLVDPDNRRPVNYSRRTQLLNSLLTDWRKNPEEMYSGLLTHWGDGRIKLLLTWLLLNLRKTDPELLLAGEYRPLPADWEERNGIIGFIRTLPEREILVALSVKVTGKLEEGEGLKARPGVYSGVPIPIFEERFSPWTHLFTKRTLLPRQSSSGEGEFLPMEDAMGGALFTVLTRGLPPVIA